jgi:hypothetical protein
MRLLKNFVNKAVVKGKKENDLLFCIKRAIYYYIMLLIAKYISGFRADFFRS